MWMPVDGGFPSHGWLAEVPILGCIPSGTTTTSLAVNKGNILFSSGSITWDVTLQRNYHVATSRQLCQWLIPKRFGIQMLKGIFDTCNAHHWLPNSAGAVFIDSDIKQPKICRCYYINDMIWYDIDIYWLFLHPSPSHHPIWIGFSPKKKTTIKSWWI